MWVLGILGTIAALTLGAVFTAKWWLPLREGDVKEAAINFFTIGLMFPMAHISVAILIATILGVKLVEEAVDLALLCAGLTVVSIIAVQFYDKESAD